MTSNLGSEFIQPTESTEAIHDKVMAIVRSHFRPEFLNRVDDIVVFERLTPEDLRQIVDIQLESVIRRVAERGMSLEITDAAEDLLAIEGFDPVYGARPLKRVIQKQLVDRLALEMLDGSYTEGDRIVVDARDGELVFESAESGGGMAE
jgi:ATP-dependent Clp protease ATP-binding subunit ClpB